MNEMILLVSNQEKRSVVLFSYFFFCKIFPEFFSISGQIIKEWHGYEHHLPFMLQQGKGKSLRPTFQSHLKRLFLPQYSRNPDYSLITRLFMWTHISEVQRVSRLRKILRFRDGKERDVKPEKDYCHKWINVLAFSKISSNRDRPTMCHNTTLNQHLQLLMALLRH